MDYLIDIISKNSNRYGDKLIKFLNEYNLIGLRDATEKQLTDFIKKEGFLK